jgi:hypothetical protein
LQQPEAKLKQAQVAAITPVDEFVQTLLQCQDTKKK